MTPANSAERVNDPYPVTMPTGETWTLWVQPSGVIRWSYEAMGGEVVGLVVAVVAALVNAAGRLAFRFGWSVVVVDDQERTVERHRFRSRAAARAALPGLAASIRRSGRHRD